MKKIHVMLIAMAALLSSNAVMAIDLGAGPNPVKLTDCSQLANDIDITISSNVVGNLDCTTNTTHISLAVCHTSGLTTSRSFSESPTTDATTGEKTCSSGTLNADQTACTGTTTGARFPTATTAAGTVSSNYPGENCSVSQATTIAGTALNGL